VAVDIAKVIRSYDDRWTAVFPNRAEQLSGPSLADDATATPQKKPHLGHDDDILPGNVVYLECLPKDALRLPVRVQVGRVKSVDPVLVPECEGRK
jgi:hypothetical protein